MDFSTQVVAEKGGKCSHTSDTKSAKICRLGLLDSGGSGGSGKTLALAALPVSPAMSPAPERGRAVGRRGGAKKKEATNKINARRAGGGRFSLCWQLAAAGPRPQGPAAAEGLGRRRPRGQASVTAPQHTGSEHGVCQHGVCQHGVCQHPRSQPRQPRDRPVLFRNIGTSRVARLGWLRGVWEGIGISRPTDRRPPSEEEPSAGGEARPSYAKTDPEPPAARVAPCAIPARKQKHARSAAPYPPASKNPQTKTRSLSAR